MDHRRLDDLLQSVLLPELGVRVTLGVLVANTGNLREILRTSAVSEEVSQYILLLHNGKVGSLLHILSARISKVLRVPGAVMLPI